MTISSAFCRSFPIHGPPFPNLSGEPTQLARLKPDELVDLGAQAAQEDVIEMMYDWLPAWALRPSQKTTRSDAQILEMRNKPRRRGVVLGLYDESEAEAELLVKYLPR